MLIDSPKLESPKLDTRTFQDLVDDAKRQIQQRCPGWTDHNVSDPGVMLVELFAYMTEIFLYRLNQVPDRNYTAFLKLMGALPEPARPAAGKVTFLLSSPPSEQSAGVTIAAGTEVETSRQSDEESVVFTTDHEYTIRPPLLRVFLSAVDKDNWGEGLSSDQLRGKSLTLCSSGGDKGVIQGFALGFEEDLSDYRLALTFTSIRPEGKDLPNMSWEVYCLSENGTDKSPQWKEVLPVQKAEPKPGLTVLDLPSGCAKGTFKELTAATWIRGIRQTPANGSGAVAHQAEPQSWEAVVKVETKGAAIPVTQARWTKDEERLGRSNGLPGQSFTLRLGPLLEPVDRKDFVQVENALGNWESWTIVDDFADSECGKCGNDPEREDKNHCVLDLREGTVTFGPCINNNIQFGKIPRQGALIRIPKYRVGGGERGNLPADRIRVMRTTIPGVSDVTNLRPTTGGRDTETLEAAKIRAPGRMRSLADSRAVTAEDFERQAREYPGVGRVYCVRQDYGTPQTENNSANTTDEEKKEEERRLFKPGLVKLLVIPKLRDLDDQWLKERGDKQFTIDDFKKELAIGEDFRDKLLNYLYPKALITTKIEILEPIYTWLQVSIRIKPRSQARANQVKKDLERALYRYFHPTFGGEDQKGWNFGHDVTIDMVYKVLQGIQGIDSANEARLHKYKNESGGWKIVPASTDVRRGEDGKEVRIDQYDLLPLSLHSVIQSGTHSVSFIDK